MILDMEHGPADFETIENMVRAAELVGITSLVRVGDLSPNWILRSLETGAQGVVVPHVRSAADAKLIVEASSYHPEGNRGVCRVTRAAKYSATPIFNHIRYSNETTARIGLIEDAEALDNLVDIVNTPGLHAIMVGPVDLSHSLGYGGDPDADGMADVIAKIFDVASTSSCVVGSYVTQPEDIRRYLELGARFIWYNMPARVLLDGYKNALTEMKKIAELSTSTGERCHD